MDKTAGGANVKEENDPVKITGFTDRVYMKAPDSVILRGLEGGRALELTKVGIILTNYVILVHF